MTVAATPVHPSVFVSHNKADAEIARTVALFLISEEISVWFDEWEISAGDSIVGKVDDALAKCTHFVIVWSKNSSKSNWVRKELSSALSNAIQKKTLVIIPLKIDDTELPPLLSDIRHISYHGGTEDDRREIVNAISGKQPTVNFMKAVVKKYNEVVYEKDYDGPDPFGNIKACPSCGSTDFKRSMFNDYARDDIWFFIECKECKWSSASE
jgi:hypothetical protein